VLQTPITAARPDAPKDSGLPGSLCLGLLDLCSTSPRALRHPEPNADVT
jgi:hypothetical protein